VGLVSDLLGLYEREVGRGGRVRRAGWSAAVGALWGLFSGLVMLGVGGSAWLVAVCGVAGGAAACGCLYVRFGRVVDAEAEVAWRHGERARWGALAGLVVVPMLTAVVAWWSYCAPPSKVRILVADLDGPELRGYHVTDTVINGLKAAVREYGDVEVKELGFVVTEAQGSEVARGIGKRRKATIMIWGWYAKGGEAVQVVTHFEVLRPPRGMPELGEEAKGKPRVMPVEVLESFALHGELSGQMAYLCLFTAGLTRFSAGDWGGAVQRFSKALEQRGEPGQALDRSVVYWYRGNTYLLGSDLDRAIADYTQAIEVNPEMAWAWNNRGVAHVKKGDVEQEIADFTRAIEVRPDWAEAYVNRGVAYGEMGRVVEAEADLGRALELAKDEELRRRIGEELRKLEEG
jgi:Flp pilus assembly protein TadD